MSEPITAGVLKDMLNLIKSISDKLFQFLSSSDDFSLKDVKDINEDTKELQLYYKDKIPVYVTQKKVGDGVYDLTFYLVDKGKNPIKKTRVKEENFKKVYYDVCEENLDDDTLKSFGVIAARKLQVTLQKITSAEGVEIHLQRIAANYAPDEALATLNTVLDAPEMTEAITDEPVSFEIVDLDSDYDVAPIETVTLNPYEEVCRYLFAKAALLTELKVRFNHAQYRFAMEYADSCLWFINDSIRSYMEQSVIDFNEIPQLCCSIQPCDCLNTQLTLTEKDAYDCVHKVAEETAMCIDCFTTCLPPALYAEAQRNLQDFLRQSEYYKCC